MDNRLFTCSAFLGLKKVFDVSGYHSTLLNKPRYSGIVGNVFDSIGFKFTFVTESNEQVNGTASDKRINSHGVTQG